MSQGVGAYVARLGALASAFALAGGMAVAGGSRDQGDSSCVAHADAIRIAYFRQRLADAFGRFKHWERGECVALALGYSPETGISPSLEDPSAEVVRRVRERFQEASALSECEHRTRLIALGQILCYGPKSAMVRPGRYHEPDYRVRLRRWRGWRAEWVFTID